MSANATNISLPHGRPIAVVVAREGRLPIGADEAVAEAGGTGLVVGSGAMQAASQLQAATHVSCCDTGDGFRPGALAQALADRLASAPLVILPSSPDGRDLAPRLAASMGRPLLACVEQVSCRSEAGGPRIEAVLWRIDGRLSVPVCCSVPAVATLLSGVRSVAPASEAAAPVPWPPLTLRDDILDVQLLDIMRPEAAAIELGEASRVAAGGAGLVPRGADTAQARAMFELLREVAAALDASVGATRVATDAGWIGHDRQIGTTGARIRPTLYLAFGISGASQHVAALGTPQYVVSVNRDASAPMTAMSHFGIVADAPAMLVEMARRLGVTVPDEVAQLVAPGGDSQLPAGNPGHA